MEAQQWENQSQGQSQGGSPLSTSGTILISQRYIVPAPRRQSHDFIMALYSPMTLMSTITIGKQTHCTVHWLIVSYLVVCWQVNVIVI
jgi:hypothetical protein